MSIWELVGLAIGLMAAASITRRPRVAPSNHESARARILLDTDMRVEEARRQAEEQYRAIMQESNERLYRENAERLRRDHDERLAFEEAESRRRLEASDHLHRMTLDSLRNKHRREVE